MRLTDTQEDVLYFNRTDMFAILDMQRKESDKAINSVDPDTLLNTPTDDVVEDIVDNTGLRCRSCRAMRLTWTRLAK